MVRTYNAEGDLVELETGGKRKARRLLDHGVMDDEIRSDDGNSRAYNAAKNAARNNGIPFSMSNLL